MVEGVVSLTGLWPSRSEACQGWWWLSREEQHLWIQAFQSKEGFKLQLLQKRVLNLSHIKANDTNKHLGPEVGQQAVNKALQEKDKATLVSKPASMEPQLKPSTLTHGA